MTPGCDDSRVGAGTGGNLGQTMSSKFLSPQSVVPFGSVPFAGKFTPAHPTWIGRGVQMLRTGPVCQ